MNLEWFFKLNPLGLASADAYIIKRINFSISVLVTSSYHETNKNNSRQKSVVFNHSFYLLSFISKNSLNKSSAHELFMKS